MRKLILLIAVIGLFLCSLDVWAGGPQIDTVETPSFIITNAL